MVISVMEEIKTLMWLEIKGKLQKKGNLNYNQELKRSQKG